MPDLRNKFGAGLASQTPTASLPSRNGREVLKAHCSTCGSVVALADGVYAEHFAILRIPCPAGGDTPPPMSIIRNAALCTACAYGDHQMSADRHCSCPCHGGNR